MLSIKPVTENAAKHNNSKAMMHSGTTEVSNSSTVSYLNFHNISNISQNDVLKNLFIEQFRKCINCK